MRKFSISLTTVAAVGLTATAFAAAPTPGASLTGKVKKADRNGVSLMLKVNGSATRLRAVITCDDLPYTLKSVKIAKSGAFEKKGRIIGLSVLIKGRFKSGTKATGKLDTDICFVGKKGRFKVKA